MITIEKPQTYGSLVLPLLRYVTKLLRTTHFFTSIISFYLWSRGTDKAGERGWCIRRTCGDAEQRFRRLDEVKRRV